MGVNARPQHVSHRAGSDAEPMTVAIALRNPDLRNLVRADLEAQGFVITSVTAGPHTSPRVDVLVTEFAGTALRLIVHVVDDLGGAATHGIDTDGGHVVRLPATELGRLARVIRRGART